MKKGMMKEITFHKSYYLLFHHTILLLSNSSSFTSWSWLQSIHVFIYWQVFVHRHRQDKGHEEKVIHTPQAEAVAQPPLLLLFSDLFCFLLNDHSCITNLMTNHSFCKICDNKTIKASIYVIRLSCSDFEAQLNIR